MLKELFNKLLFSYEERLRPVEKELFDRFADAKMQGHQALVVFQHRTDSGLSYFSIPENVSVKQCVSEIIKDNPDYCGRLILALDLKQDFRSQWCKEPGHIDNLDFLNKCPLVRVPDLFGFVKLPSLKRDKS
jgi:hypothetical protein